MPTLRQSVYRAATIGRKVQTNAAVPSARLWRESLESQSPPTISCNRHLSSRGLPLRTPEDSVILKYFLEYCCCCCCCCGASIDAAVPPSRTCCCWHAGAVALQATSSHARASFSAPFHWPTKVGAVRMISSNRRIYSSTE